MKPSYYGNMLSIMLFISAAQNLYATYKYKTSNKRNNVRLNHIPINNIYVHTMRATYTGASPYLPVAETRSFISAVCSYVLDFRIFVYKAQQT